MSSRTIIVSNRLPIKVKKTKKGYSFENTVGGLASGLDSFQKANNSSWVGWPGTFTHKEDLSEEKKIRTKLVSQYNYYPVFQNQNDIEKYYLGYCNSTLWPVLHYFSQYAIYEKSFWQAYRRVNRMFCDEVVSRVKKGETIWIHDYHLMLLPQYLRERLPNAKIGFFLHTPFPSYEIFRILPQRKDIINGLLGADLIGFQTYDYAKHFLNSVYRLFGYEDSLGQIDIGDRFVKVDTFPIGINFQKFNRSLKDPIVQIEMKKYEKKIGSRRIILSIDRLDYTKGIPNRLEAFQDFLERYPEYREKVTLIVVAVPSRTKVDQYRDLKKKVDELVGRINGKYGNIGWTPIWYLYQSLDFPKLVSLYNLADICLVTPLRDGMNLIAKEYVASRANKEGVLIISERIGAAEELRDALIVNPNNRDEVVETIKKALEMSKEEQKVRNDSMQKELYFYDEKRWAKSFLDSVGDVKKLQNTLAEKVLDSKDRENLIKDYKRSKRRLILLDYDGTLVSFVGTPGEAKPDEDLLNILRKLSKNPKNEVLLISGRDRKNLKEWFGNLGVSLAAEHGIWLKKGMNEWEKIEDLKTSWKRDIRPILEDYVEKTPGSFVEEKEHSLGWHYRKADPELGPIRLREIVSILENVKTKYNLRLLEGSKVIEVKNANINKGRAVSQWLGDKDWDFILALGDDTTDEDMFEVLPESAYSIKVGLGRTKARYNVKSNKEVRPILLDLKD